jgi:hypothetical protein
VGTVVKVNVTSRAKATQVTVVFPKYFIIFLLSLPSLKAAFSQPLGEKMQGLSAK